MPRSRSMPPGQNFTGKVLEVPLQGMLQGDVMVYSVPISLTGAETWRYGWA